MPNEDTMNGVKLGTKEDVRKETKKYAKWG